MRCLEPLQDLPQLLDYLHQMILFAVLDLHLHPFTILTIVHESALVLYIPKIEIQLLEIFS